MKKEFLYLAIVIISCQASTEEVQKGTTPLFEKGIELGKASDAIKEASGLATSVNNPGTLWTHNDSGWEAKIFLIDEKAELQAIVTLEGIENRDWEDIVVGPGPDSSKNYIYISETGDNYARYQTKYIYRIEEPTLDISDGNVISMSVSDITQIPVEYADGKRDAETLFIDPHTKDLYIISKREENVNVYLLKYPQMTDQINVLNKLGTLPFRNVVAGGISIHDEILLKTYDNIYYWKINSGESIYQSISRAATVLPYKPEPQGESITWKRDGKGYFTLSEKNGIINPDLLYYKRN